jgi:hypothetical protein
MASSDATFNVGIIDSFISILRQVLIGMDIIIQ